MTAYRKSSYQVNFESVSDIEDASMVAMFKSLETTGLHTSISFSMIIYEDSLLESHKFLNYLSQGSTDE